MPFNDAGPIWFSFAPRQLARITVATSLLTQKF